MLVFSLLLLLFWASLIVADGDVMIRMPGWLGGVLGCSNATWHSVITTANTPIHLVFSIANAGASLKLSKNGASLVDSVADSKCD